MHTESVPTEQAFAGVGISPSQLDTLLAEMDRNGYGVLPNYVGGPDLERMQMFVAEAIASAGHQYVGFTGKEAVAGTAFADLSDSPAFLHLLRKLYERSTGRQAPAENLYQVLRCLAGETGKAHNLIFHYDSYVVTALIPVMIPTSGKAGDLIMLRPRRGIRTSYLANLADKLLLDNKATQGLLRLLHERGLLPVRRVKMVPGNAYFFWGYQTIHSNEACDPEAVRATAIYHFANPHAASSFRSQVRRLIPIGTSR